MASARTCTIPEEDLMEPVWYIYGFTLFWGHKADITSRTHVTTTLQECDFVQTFNEPQIPTFPQLYGPENTRRTHVTVALKFLCLGHMKLPGSSWPLRYSHGMPCRPAQCFEDFWTRMAPYFHTRTVFLRFCAGRMPVDGLAGTVLAPPGQMAHNITRRWLHGPHRSLYGPARLIIRIFTSPIMASARCPHT